jgi:hypothetical protein
VTIERVRAQGPGSPQQTWRWPVHCPAEKIAVDTTVKWEDPPATFHPPILGNAEPPFEAGRVQPLPPADSVWNDAGWRDAAVWRLWLAEPTPRLPRFPTEIKLLQDGKILAVLARCVEPDEPQATSIRLP